MFGELDDDYTTRAEYNAPNEHSNIIIPPSYYDKLVTTLHLQAIKGYNKNSVHQHNKKKILLVDDEPDTCLLYKIVLHEAGYECNTYTDPVKALQEFRAGYYDLILLDIKMPILNGFELCKNIRELDKTVQIIFITASEISFENFRSHHYPELSNIYCIQKPIENEELIKIVDITIATSSK